MQQLRELDNLGLASSHPFWLSLVLESGSWVWKAEESPSFLNWKHGEPNHCCPEEEASNAFSEPSGWSDTSYLSKYAVVCKYKSKSPDLYQKY